MSKENFELMQSRAELQKNINAVNDLLDALESENEKRTGYIKELAQKRIAIFDALIDNIVQYDSKVIRYQTINQPGNNAAYYKNQLTIAKKYIKAIGGDFNSVLWGRDTDYPN
jgi:SMC interacting uncharacterized protein involved in chromosome segregation